MWFQHDYLLDAQGHTLQSKYQARTLFTNKCHSDRDLLQLPWLESYLLDRGSNSLSPVLHGRKQQKSHCLLVVHIYSPTSLSLLASTCSLRKVLEPEVQC
jgi:hypothetical protein